MKQELAQDIALMRYSMISPLIVGLPDEYKSKEACTRMSISTTRRSTLP